MKTLIAFALIVGTVLADPQFFYSGVVPGAHSYYAPGVVTPYAYTHPYTHPVVPAVTYPAQDTSRGIPQTVQDTPAVQLAKSAFAAEYAATVSRNTGAVAIPVHKINKRQAIIPIKTPASTTPLVYSAPAVVHTPYVGAHVYTGYPYTTYPYVL